MRRTTVTRLLAALVVALAARHACAQGGQQRAPTSAPVEIRGQVRYSNGGAPAENVVVRLESFRGGTIGEIVTDRSGKFRFERLTPDDYIVRVRHAGYKETERRVDLLRVNSEYVFLQLEADRTAAAAAPAQRVSPLVIDASVPAPAREEFERGRELVLAGKVEQGLPALEKAVALHPNFFEAHLMLGTALMGLGRWEQAERSLRSARAAKPGAAPALFALGEVFRRQKKYEEAERVLQEGLKLDDKSPQGHLALGRVYWERNDLAKAGPEVGRAIKLKPDYAEAHLLAGNILLRARRPENALVEFEEYLRLAPRGEFAAQARTAAERIKKALAEQKK